MNQPFDPASSSNFRCPAVRTEQTAAALNRLMYHRDLTPKFLAVEFMEKCGYIYIYIYIYINVCIIYIYIFFNVYIHAIGWFLHWNDQQNTLTRFLCFQTMPATRLRFERLCSSAASAGCCRRPKMGVLVQRTTSRREVRSVCSVSARMELDAATSCCRVGQGDATFPCRRWSQSWLPWLRKYLRTK